MLGLIQKNTPTPLAFQLVFLDDGKLYVDNFHYMRKNGTEHTGDPAGFSTIGAEPYYRGHERVYRSQLPDDPLMTGIYSYSGPYIITNQIWPEQPIY